MVHFFTQAESIPSDGNVDPTIVIGLLVMLVGHLFLTRVTGSASNPDRVTTSQQKPRSLAASSPVHMPVLYDAALRSQPIHVLEHTTFIAAGILA